MDNPFWSLSYFSLILLAILSNTFIIDVVPLEVAFCQSHCTDFRIAQYLAMVYLKRHDEDLTIAGSFYDI